MPMGFRIGCDVGGTFTDVCLIDPGTGESRFAKVPTTPADQAEAVLAGARQALRPEPEGRREDDAQGADAASVEGFSHATTVAVNAILEARGAPTVLLVTRGFRDTLAIGRQTRPSLYDAAQRRPAPLVPGELTVELDERIGTDGRVLRPLSDAEVARAVEAVAALVSARGATSLAVVLINSFANPAHERRIGEALAAAFPGIGVSLSVDVLPEPGEYERLSTTVMNAYVRPVLGRYLTRLSDGLCRMGVRAEPTLMQSNGGIMSFRAASEDRAVHTCLSGPAAGLIAARAFVKAAGFANAITIDMGGTSFDVGLIQDGEVMLRYGGEIADFPLAVPMFDIVNLGAGGGSIARVDEAGLLKVGPGSAGADPGPAAYRQGGIRPTVTDANVVLGRLRNGRRLGGRGGIRLDAPAARHAVDLHVAAPTGLTVEAAADGILRVATAAMIRGIRRMTVERGLDPRDFALFAFGGAGPLHAMDLAAELGIRDVLVPPSPGLLSAIGLLIAPWRYDFQAPLLSQVGSLDSDRLDALMAELEAKARAQAERDGVPVGRLSFQRAGDLRYVGQGERLTVPIDIGAPPAKAADAFHALHRRLFGFARPDHPVEVTTLRLDASAPAASGALPVPPLLPGEPEIARTSVYLRDGETMPMAPTTVPVLARDRLPPGTPVPSPALIEQDDTTVFLDAGRAEVDVNGILHIRREGPMT